jgi:glycosyltransferase involved in cell wall biosynthesis
MRKNNTVTIIIPVLNFEETLENVIRKIERIADEIIVVCDITDTEKESKIKSWMGMLQAKYGIKPVLRVNEKGFGSAIILGFQKASKEITIVMTGDNSDDTETIPKMLEAIESHDVVCVTRFSKGGGVKGNMFKTRVSRIISLALRIFSRSKSSDVNNSFKAYRTSAIKTIQTKENSFAFTLEMFAKLLEKGYSITEVPTVWSNRESGKPNFQVKKEGRGYAFWTFYAIIKMPSVITKLIYLWIVGVFIFLAL